MNNKLHFKTKQEWNQEFVLLYRQTKLVLCVNLCNNDMDCQGAQKCCSNGYGRVCTDITTTGELVTREVAWLVRSWVFPS